MAQIVTIGEVLMRLSTPGFSRFEQARSLDVTYAGGEANEASALAYWGHSTAHVTRFPDSPIGRAAAHYLRFHGVDISHISFGGPRMAVYLRAGFIGWEQKKTMAKIKRQPRRSAEPEVQMPGHCR